MFPAEVSNSVAYPHKLTKAITPSTKKVHVIFNHNDKNHLIKKDIRCKDDVFTHLYTLILNPDGSYEVLIDNEKAESGKLEDDWDFLQLQCALHFNSQLSGIPADKVGRHFK